MSYSVLEYIMSQSAGLCQRCLVPEIMDQPDLEDERLIHALQGISRLNRWSGSAGILWPPIEALARARGNRVLTVLDIATGGGDVPIRLRRKGRHAGIDLKIEGCDISQCAVDYARECAERKGSNVTFFRHDALGEALPTQYDIVMCSLFLHHLDDERAAELLRRMAQAARHLVLINDLRRSRGGLTLAHVATRLLTTSAVVHFDGPQSVRAAFTIDEMAALARRAGLRGVNIEKRWPCRFLLTWRRP
jgi:2-polyprenyl-3-methyl-5-hydroxy-6-metoxy-1,4-benzoquinol methylase